MQSNLPLVGALVVAVGWWWFVAPSTDCAESLVDDWLIHRSQTQVLRLPASPAPFDESVDALLRRVSTAFGVNATRLLRMWGEPVLQLSQVTDRRVFALESHEPFMWPAFRVGDRTRVRLADEREVRVTVLSTHPRVFELDNFLAEDECAHMIARAQRENLVESTVGSEQAAAIKSALRTSSQAWVGPGQHNDDDVFSRVRRRVVEITRLNESVAEDTQIVRYLPGQHYMPHLDYTDSAGKSDPNPYYAAGGNRFVTVLYYLSDMPDGAGGETRFPYANSTLSSRPVGEGRFDAPVPVCSEAAQGLRVQPRRGRAVLFYNLLEERRFEEGRGDRASLHVGCPPTQDTEKWLANQWVRNKRVQVNGKAHLYDANW